MGVLLDTNVLIAAFISRGACADLLEHVIRQHEVVSSDALLEELRTYVVTVCLTAIGQVRVQVGRSRAQTSRASGGRGSVRRRSTRRRIR